jgi:arylsulfatase A-like enzyme
MRNEPLSEAQVRELLHGYYACVSFIDAQIGRLLGELDRLGLRENTIIMLWGDNGWHLGEQDLWGKMTGFELSARVPLIVCAPGRKARGAGSSALVEFVDLFPTLCELAGLPPPNGLEGTSFVPLLDAPDRPWKPAAFTQLVRGQATGRSIRTERHRLTRWTSTKDPNEVVGVELYDYAASPLETENLAGRPEYATLERELAARL